MEELEYQMIDLTVVVGQEILFIQLKLKNWAY